ncbi:hypothetical protein MMC19_005914 [Ptychographa xylographoides]|nr:hypothetical protein [Ptychographa xylographoides]
MSSIRFQDTTTATTMKAETPWDRTGTPADVAKVAVFLASDDAGWVTGVAVPVDGGFAAR